MRTGVRAARECVVWVTQSTPGGVSPDERRRTLTVEDPTPTQSQLGNQGEL